MNKYGIDHFHWEMIEECDIDLLGEREQYWIAFYNTYHYGYNATLGGEGKPLYNHQAILEKLQICPYPCLVAQEFGCSTDLVRAIAKRNNIELYNLGNETMKQIKSKRIQAFDKQTQQFLCEFNSTADAAKWCYKNQYAKSLNSGVRAHIADCANGKRKSAYGFVWKYKE